MHMEMTDLLLGVKQKTGLKFFQGPPSNFFLSCKEEKIVNNVDIRKFFYSNNGHHFCLIDAKCVYLCHCEELVIKNKVLSHKDDDSENKLTNILNIGNVKDALFSPLSTYLITWQDPDPKFSNLQIWDVKTGKFVHGYKVSKQYRWELQWTSDEKLMARFADNHICFYETPHFDKIVAKSPSDLPITTFTLSPRMAQTFLATFSRGSKGQPSFVRILQYPSLSVNSLLPSKSSFAGETVQFYWNSTGQSLLALLTAEVDKTNESYYGQQFLFLLSLAKEGDACRVDLPKEGPIYSVAWCPARLTKTVDAFVVIYGHMLSKATLYDAKGDVLFDFGTGRRNGCQFSPQGHTLTGSGNIQGNVEFWEIPISTPNGNLTKPGTLNQTSSEQQQQQYCCKLISHVIMKDSPTFFCWCPDGEHFTVATTTPRLRVDNGFSIYHYTGAMIFHVSLDVLYDLQWRPVDLPAKPIKYTKMKSTEQSNGPIKGNPQPAGKYVPPHLRQAGGDGAAKKLAENHPVALHHRVQLPSSNQEKPLAKDAEKRIRNVKKRLKQIEALKEEAAQGKKLDPTQLEKIQNEDKLLQELEQLEI